MLADHLRPKIVESVDRAAFWALVMSIAAFPLLLVYLLGVPLAVFVLWLRRQGQPGR